MSDATADTTTAERSDKAPKATPTIQTQGPMTPRRKPRSADRNYAVPFGVALVAGVTVLILTPSSLWWAPIVVMAAYFAWGARSARQTGLVMEFSDSFYYLGFALTLTALLRSTGALGGELLPAKVMVIEFGKGLATTIVGVVGRVGMQLYYQVTQEAVEETTRKVQEAARTFVETLRTANQDIEKYLPEAAVGLARAAGKIEEEAVRIEKSLTATATRLGSNEADIASVFQTVATELRKSGLAGELYQLGQSVQRTRSTIVAEAGEGERDVSLQTAVRRVVSAIDDLDERLRGLGSNVQTVGGEVADLRKVLHEISQATIDQLRKLPR